MSSSTFLPTRPPDSGEPVTAAHLRAALDGWSGGLLTFDRKQRVLFFSNPLAQTLDIPGNVLIGGASIMEVLESSRALDAAAVQRIHELCLGVIDEAPQQRATVSVASGSATRFLSIGIVRLRDGCAMASFEDVTALRDAEMRAIERAMSDPLTGLPSREMFRKRITELLEPSGGTSQADGAASAVLLVDLDRFKAINDKLGHPIGDGLLRLVARRLRSVVRQRDLVARIGGDEFAVLVSPVVDRQSLGELARRIVDLLGRPYLVDGHLLTIGASLGLAIAPTDADDDEHLLRAADLALYEAKSAGRNRFVAFRSDMDAKAVARRSLEIDLRKALVMRQFELFYQPQVNLEAETVVGFEALLRWRHPERGLVPPADFIPLAEEIGLIISLGEWVIREACRQAAGWPDDISVAVNVSPLQFEDADRLVAVIIAALEGSGLSGARL